VKQLSDCIKHSNNASLISFLKGLNEIYRYQGLKQFFANDLINVNEFSETIEEFLQSEKGEIRKYNLNLIQNKLKSVIEDLESQ